MEFYLGGGFKYFFMFIPYSVNIPVLTNIFSYWLGSTTNQYICSSFFVSHIFHQPSTDPRCWVGFFQLQVNCLNGATCDIMRAAWLGQDLPGPRMIRMPVAKEGLGWDVLLQIECTPKVYHGAWEYTPGKGKSSSKPSFSGSMLNFGGVTMVVSLFNGTGRGPHYQHRKYYISTLS